MQDTLPYFLNITFDLYKLLPKKKFRNIYTRWAKSRYTVYSIVLVYYFWPTLYNCREFRENVSSEKKNNTLERKYMYVRTNHIYWRSVWNLVQGICKFCGRGNVKSAPIAAGKVARSLQASIKLHLHFYHDTIWHSRNKERLGDACTLIHNLHYPVFCLNKYKTSIYTHYTTPYIERQKREWKFYSSLRNVGKHEVQKITERKREQQAFVVRRVVMN